MASSNYFAAYSSSNTNHIAREWIKECEDKHSICRKSMTITAFTLPRRLIHIGTPGSRTPFLVETTSLKEKSCRYATLSHRWGDQSKLLQTVRSNLSEHYKHIAWDALPKTFRDAIMISQCLGLEYLWIDSLCIIQQDRVDFENECSQMHLIYLHCYCMIAASDAQDASEGFLQSWDDFHEQDSNTSISNPPNFKDVPAFRPQSTQFRDKQFIKWDQWTEVLDGTLNKRGWTYQERQLSPRILHFTRHGVMWECRLCIGAGDLRNLQFRRTSWGWYNTTRKEFNTFSPALVPQMKLFRILDIDKSRLSLDDLMNMWLLIAEEYSHRHLSYSEDKLPALSGLAAAISSIITSQSVPRTPEYLAGVWLSHMHQQLFWSPKMSGTSNLAVSTRRTGKANLLPSWSWSSCENPITFHQALVRLIESIGVPDPGAYLNISYLDAQDLRPLDIVEFVSTGISPGGSDPFGRIQGGDLKVRGRFWDEDVSEATLLRKDCQRYELQVFCPPNERIKTQFSLDFRPLNLEGLTLRFLPLLDGSKYWHYCGIVLQASEGNKFRRIGIFGSSHYIRKSNLGEMTLI